jgi:hypothetical protein
MPSASDITTGTFDNARINWASPSALGSSTPAAVTGTTVTGNTSVLTDLLDARTSAALVIGTTNATGITMQQTTTFAAGKSISFSAGAGGLSLSAGTGDWAMPTGSGSWAGASGKSLSLVAGTSAAITITAAAGSVWSTSSGSLSLEGGSVLNLGVVSSPAVAIGHSGITTTITGGLTQQTGAISLTGNAASSIVNSSGAFTFSGFSGINLQRAGATVIDIGVTSTNNVTLAAGKSLSMAAGAGALSLGSGTGDSTLTTGAFSWTGANNKALTFTAQGASGTVSIFSGAGAIAIQSSSNDITITTVSNGAQLWLVSGTGRYVLNGDDGGTFKYSTSDRYLLRSASHVWTVGNGSGSTTVGYTFCFFFFYKFY